MPIATLFIQKYCDRCRRKLGEKRELSFSTGEVLCMDCSVNEEEGRKGTWRQDADTMVDAHQEIELEVIQEETKPKK